MNINSVSATRCMTLVAVGLLVPGTKPAATVFPADQDFLLAAAQGGLTELELGELAARNGLRDDVKQFAQMMVKDHTILRDRLKMLAAQKGVSLPYGLDAEHQASVDKMAGLMGPAFDDAYISRSIKDHKLAAKAFQTESSATKDGDIKRFVEKSLPVLAAHLQFIKALKT